MIDTVWSSLVALILSEAVLGWLAVVLVGVVGLLIRRFKHSRHVINLAILAYKYAEKEGLLREFRGYEKLSIFMQDFVYKYKEEHHGKEPTPDDKALALKTAEKEVLKEVH